MKNAPEYRHFVLTGRTYTYSIVENVNLIIKAVTFMLANQSVSPPMRKQNYCSFNLKYVSIESLYFVLAPGKDVQIKFFEC